MWQQEGALEQKGLSVWWCLLSSTLLSSCGFGKQARGNEQGGMLGLGCNSGPFSGPE